MSARSSHAFTHFYDAPTPYLTGSARAPPQSELGLRAAATFSWGTWWPIRQGACRTFKGANPCGIESDMWTLARALVAPHHAVLELGGRYGTTSCVLAEVTNNSGKVVSVEPDPKAHNALRANLRAHACRVGVFRGTIGTRDQVLPSQDTLGRKRTYDMQTRDAPAASRGGEGITPLARLTVTELATHVGLVAFDVIVLDCEGCMPDALSDEALSQPTLSLLIFEADFNRHRPFSYGAWHVKLLRFGFRRVWRVQDALYGAAAPTHMAYQRGARPTPTCAGFAAAQLHWRCRRRVTRVRPGFNLSTLECGSRLTCLAAEVVTGSREEWEVKRALAG